ncbi:MAG: TRAP transporter small permease [Rhodocyclaceae bacterium]|nr:TRAP transporter small permease [Rhodocyclaceae bacterium]
MSHGYELPGAAQAAAPQVGGALAPFAKGLDLVNRAALGVSMLAILVASGILTSSVALRYFLHIPTDWQDEAAVFLLVGATFSCGAWVQAQRGHIGIEALAGVLPEAVNRFRKWMCDAASMLYCSFFAWKSWTLFHEAWSEGMTTSSSWAPPLWIPYSFMAVGMSLLSLQLLLQVLAGQPATENKR